MVSNKKAVKILQDKFPKISGIRTGEEWDADIFLGDCAEGGEIDDMPACNYYGGYEDPKEKIWIMGVHKKLREELNRLGYYPECHDPGTYVAYKE